MRLVWLILTLLVIPSASHAAVNEFNQDVQMCSGRPWIDVTCNGADTTGNADSTTAINTTVNSAITNGWPVFFPSGTYKISSKLTWDYQGQSGNGLEIISRGAVIDGRTVVSGNVLQVQCSGGTTASPAVCRNFRISGNLTILGTTNAYVFVFGKTDFSDRHDAAKIEHLIVTNNNNNTSAGAAQFNYVTDGDIWISGSTPGGSSSTGAVALEQVQSSKFGGYASALGASAPGLLIENGVSSNDAFVGFGYDPNNNTCISITSGTATRNAWLAPSLPCTTAVNAPPASAQNALIGPTFAGTNMGPTSTGIATIGRGSLNRVSAPAVSSYTSSGAEDGTIYSSANALGSPTQFTAASLPITLPSPVSVGAGWSVGFVTDAGKAVVVTPSVGKILAGSLALSSLIVGPGNYEFAAVKSDGANFRLVYATRNTKLGAGIESAAQPTNWIYPGGPGYQTTQGDNGNVVSSGQVSSALAVTLPSTTQIQPGWTIGVSSEGGHSVTISTNGTSGGSIVLPSGNALQSYTVPTGQTWQQTNLVFDGTVFRATQGTNISFVIPAPTHQITSTSAGTPSGNPTLHFTAVPAGVASGWSLYDATVPAAISGYNVLSISGGTVTMNANAAAPVGTGDVIYFFQPAIPGIRMWATSLASPTSPGWGLPMGHFAVENQNSLIGATANTLPPSFSAYPVGTVGYGLLTPGAAGNAVFGLYGEADLADVGTAVGAEIDCFNYKGDYTAGIPPFNPIGTNQNICIGMQLGAGGQYRSAVGLHVGGAAGGAYAAGSPQRWTDGIYVGGGTAATSGATRYGLFIDADSSGPGTTAVLQNYGTGVNLQLGTIGPKIGVNSVLDVLDQNGLGQFSINQDGDTFFAGHLASAQYGTPSVSSCGAGATISGNSTDTRGVITVGSGVVTSCTLTFRRSFGNGLEYCTVTTGAGGNGYPFIATASDLAITIGISVSSPGVNLYYMCMQ